MRNAALGVLGACAVAFVWFSDYVTPLGFTISTLLGFAALCLVTLIVLAEGRVLLSKGFMQLVAISFALLLWAAFVYLINNAYPQGIRRLGQIALGISISFATSFTVNSPARITAFVSCLLVGVFVSAVVGIGQRFIGEPFISLWLASGQFPEARLDTVQVLVPGLAPTSILLGYQLVASMPLAMALVLSGRYVVGRRWKWFFAITLATMALAVVLSGSRSAVAGAIFGVALTGFMMRSGKTKWSPNLISAGVFMIVLYLVVGYLYAPSRFVGLKDLSAATRLPLFITAIRYAIDHPLGTGVYEPVEIYLPSHLDPRVVEAILRLTPHNQFLNILVYYGLPGLILLTAFYCVVLAQLYKIWRLVVRKHYDLRWVMAGLTGAILGYLLNSLFHNAGPFVGDWFHWFFIGLIFSTQRAALYRGYGSAIFSREYVRCSHE